VRSGIKESILREVRFELLSLEKIDFSWAQLFEGQLALNPALNLTQVSFSFVGKHFLG